MPVLCVNWGSCMFGVAFNDEDNCFNLYFGPFCLVIPLDTDIDDRSKPA